MVKVELSEPVVLSPGDCAYFASTLKHGLPTVDDTETYVFWACTYLNMDR
ncbi:hypothetical protein P775_27960 [Puniceibacterium antarcticum]|uniref:Uncharacterized protein n=1 Tax=Puniceibacterium antarcticum TaxID=1206336 RepID=A0A2G8QWX4_9RHOB|nr:hypothetical protein [Puniceibacterium antarcticum]PIL13803.1 hypothetical protein P775_27960 [Puniceibacterium antarcticum]